MSTHLPLQILSFLVLLPATQATNIWVSGSQEFIARIPWLLQFVLPWWLPTCEYFIHLLHKVPFLWRFHAVHHSSKALDWIAGSRSHFVDDTLVRDLSLLLSCLAFRNSIIMAYLIFCYHSRHLDSLQFSVQCKCSKNIWLCQISSLASYFSKKRASIKNFAIHFRGLIDFWNYYYPDKWPNTYGLDGEEIAHGFLGKRLSRLQKGKETS